MEKFQTLEDFKKSKKISPTSTRKIIYLQPIGTFDSLEFKEIQLLKNYLSIYFQLETKILPEISTEIIPKNKKRIGKEDNEQLLAGYILDTLLKDKIPEDGVVLMGISKKDLYPKPEWNYVFGMASYENGVGVTSIHRFQKGGLSSDNFEKSLERLLKISSHEIGHMFGITHCLHANCVMNGTNSLSETDRHYARACSLCQEKLNFSLKYDNRKRLEDLNDYFSKNNLLRENQIVKKDLALFKN